MPLNGNQPGSTHWGQVMPICVSKLIIIGSDIGLLPGRCQAIIWTNAGILSIGILVTNFCEILSGIHEFSSRKCIWKCHLLNGSNFVSASMYSLQFLRKRPKFQPFVYFFCDSKDLVHKWFMSWLKSAENYCWSNFGCNGWIRTKFCRYHNSWTCCCGMWWVETCWEHYFSCKIWFYQICIMSL